MSPMYGFCPLTIILQEVALLVILMSLVITGRVRFHKSKNEADLSASVVFFNFKINRIDVINMFTKFRIV